MSTAVARERHFGSCPKFMNTIIYFLFILDHSPLPSDVALPPRREYEPGGVFRSLSGVFFRTRTLARATLLGGPICEADHYFYCFVDSVNR